MNTLPITNYGIICLRELRLTLDDKYSAGVPLPEEGNQSTIIEPGLGPGWPGLSSWDRRAQPEEATWSICPVGHPHAGKDTHMQGRTLGSAGNWHRGLFLWNLISLVGKEPELGLCSFLELSQVRGTRRVWGYSPGIQESYQESSRDTHKLGPCEYPGSAHSVLSWQGQLLTQSGDVVGQWMEHFEELLHPAYTSSWQQT